jgi:copper chaperone CopZ
VSVAVGGIPGVKKVEVSLNKGLVTIALKPGNTVRMAQIRKAVLKNAFSPKGSRVSAVGEIVINHGRPQLKLTQTNELYNLKAAPGSDAVLAALRSDAGKTVLVDGHIPAPKDEQPAELEVKSVREVELNSVQATK